MVDFLTIFFVEYSLTASHVSPWDDDLINLKQDIPLPVYFLRFFFFSQFSIFCILNRIKVSNYIWTTHHANRRIKVGAQSFYT